MMNQQVSTEEAEFRNAHPRRRWRIFALLFLAFLVFLALLAGFAVFFFPVDVVRTEIVKAIQRNTGYQCSIGSAEANVWRGDFTIHDLRVTDQVRSRSMPLIDVKTARLELSLLSLPGMLLGGDPIVHNIEVTAGIFNTDIFTPAPESATPPPPAPRPVANSEDESRSVPVTPVTQTAPAMTGNGKKLNIDIRKIVLHDIRLFGKYSDPTRSPLIIKSGQAVRKAARRYDLRLTAQNSKAGTSEFQGEISNISFPDFSTAEINGQFVFANFDLQDLCELYGFERPEGLFDISGASATIDIVRRGGTSTLTGKIRAPGLRIGSSPVFPKPRIDIVCQLAPENHRLSISRLDARDAVGAVLAGSLDLSRSDDKSPWMLEADIKESDLPSSILFRIIGKPEFANLLGGNLKLRGKLDNIDAGWSYAGFVSAGGNGDTSILVKDKWSLSADISCRQKDLTLELSSFKADFGFLTASGKLSIPLGAKPDHTGLMVQMRGRLLPAHLNLQTLHVEELSGEADWALNLQTPAGGVRELSARLSTPTGKRWTLTPAGEPVPADLGEVNIELAASGWPDSVLNVKHASLRSSALAAQFTGIFRDNKITAPFALSLRSVPLLPILHYFSPELGVAAEKIASAGSRGQLAYDLTTGDLSLTNTGITLDLPEKRQFSYQGGLVFSGSAMTLAGRNFTARLLAGPEELALASGDFTLPLTVSASAARVGSAPNATQFSGKIKGDIRAMVRALNLFDIAHELTGSSGVAALNLRFQQGEQKMALNAAFNTNRPDILWKNQRVLSCGGLRGGLAVEQESPGAAYVIKNSAMSTTDGLVQTSGSGRVVWGTGLSGDFALTQEADIPALLALFPAYAPDLAGLQGKLKSTVRLGGTAQAPVIELTAGLSKLSLRSAPDSPPLPDATINGKMLWTQTPEGIRDFRLDFLSLKTGRQALALEGKADALRLLDAGGVDFGKGASCNFLLRGDRHLLPLLLPSISKVQTAEPGPANALEISGTLESARLTPVAVTAANTGSASPSSQFMREFTLRDGHFRLDEFATQYAVLQELTGEFSLLDGILRIERATGDFGGPVQFALQMDFNQSPARARASLRGQKLKLVKCMRDIGLTTQFHSGEMSLPWPDDSGAVQFLWQGTDAATLAKTIEIPETGVHIAKLRITTHLSQPDFIKMFSYDMPQSLAEEAGNRIATRFGDRYSKPITAFYEYMDLRFSLKNGKVFVKKAAVGGGDTADFEADGIVGIDGMLDLNLRPVGNIYKTFDVSAVLEEPSLQQILGNMSPEQQAKTKEYLPRWVEEAANKRILGIHVIGHANDPIIDPKAVRDGVKANVPMLIEKIRMLFSEKELLRGVLGQDAAKGLDQFLNELNK